MQHRVTVPCPHRLVEEEEEGVHQQLHRHRQALALAARDALTGRGGGGGSPSLRDTGLPSGTIKLALAVIQDQSPPSANLRGY
jgi:hypothetical protein